MDLSENRICICWSKGIRVQSLEVELADGEPTKVATPTPQEHPSQPIRMSYSVAEAAQLLGVHYFSVYRLIQRGKLRVCRVLRGKIIVPRSELLKLLNAE